MSNYIEKNIELYQKKNDEYGKGSPKNLWKREASQERRFKKFMDVLNFEGQSILDVGCGYGDFYQYLVDRGIQPSHYVGVDLMPEHIVEAQKKLKEVDCTLLEGDFLEAQIQPVDISVLSGTLNFESDNWKETAEAFMDKMWAVSRKAIAFNMQSSHGLSGEYKALVESKRDITPGFWADFAHARTCCYALFHDYMHYDYTVFMWKKEIAWQENNDA